MNEEPGAAPAKLPGMAWLPLGLGLGLMLALTAYPRLLVGADGKADHLAATLACWAMAAGLTRGVGYVPANAWARRLLSGPASLLALLLAITQLRLGLGRLFG